MSDCASPETRASTLAYLHEHVDERGEVVASLRDIGDAIGVGMNTASRAVKHWIRSGRVVVVRKGTGGSYRTRYRLVGVDSPGRHDDAYSLAG